MDIISYLPAGSSVLFADTSLSNNGPLMIPTPLNIRSLKLMPYPSLRTFVRNGLIKTLSLITKNVTAIRSALSAGAVNVTSPMTLPAPGVMPQSSIYIETTAPKDSFCAKSAVPVSPRLKVVFPL